MHLDELKQGFESKSNFNPYREQFVFLCRGLPPTEFAVTLFDLPDTDPVCRDAPKILLKWENIMSHKQVKAANRKVKLEER